MSKWAYWADTCDGEPCCGECDECPIKDEAIEHMSDRDCKSCKYHKPDGCSRWNCEYEPAKSDLISRQDIKYHTQLEAMGNGQYEEVEVAYKNDIDDLPCVDAVKVVRCEGCEYGQYDCTHMYCDYFGHKVYEDDYCSNAVKRREP